MTQWVKRLRSAFIWTVAREAPRGFIVTIIILYTVGFMSALVWELSMRVFSDTPPDVPMGTATAYGTVIGSGLAGAWALFRWGFSRGGGEEGGP